MALDAGWAAVLGAAVGAAGPIVLYWVQNRRANALADKRRSRLRGMLNGNKFVWRSLDSLSASIGADDAATTELLIEIDARAAVGDPRKWALISRAPWPADVQPIE
jgi:hypothetical protein